MRAKKSIPSNVHSILLVDDNANGLRARKMVLEELGYNIVTAPHGRDALERFGAHVFDLVVTDYKMPHMDGIELISNLRKRQPDLPIVLISGFADTLGLNEENTGADVVIQKSANEVSHLIRAVARLMRPKPAPKRPRSATRPAPPPKVKHKAV